MRLAWKVRRPPPAILLPEDRVRVLGGDFLDLHASLRRRHEDGPGPGAVQRDPQVDLLLDRKLFLDQEPLDFATLRSGLVGHEVHAEDVLGVAGRFVGVSRQLDSATLSATAGVDLRLDDDLPARDPPPPSAPPGTVDATAPRGVGTP